MLHADCSYEARNVARTIRVPGAADQVELQNQPEVFGSNEWGRKDESKFDVPISCR
jgi:hypothetical protein